MDQKGIQGSAPIYPQNVEGFVAPPAYDQYQNYPQQIQGPSQGFYPQQQQIVTVITTTAFGPNSLTMTCPSCQKPIQSQVEFESTTKTHLMAGLICLLFWPCFCLPYMMDSCKNANHYCPHCRAYLGSFRGN